MSPAAPTTSETTPPTIAARAPGNFIDTDYSWKSWLLSVDHKRIAILYLISISFFFFVGGYSAARSYRGGYRSWLGRRLARLSRPVMALVAVAALHERPRRLPEQRGDGAVRRALVALIERIEDLIHRQLRHAALRPPRP